MWVDVLYLRERGFQKLIHNRAGEYIVFLGLRRSKEGSCPPEVYVLRLFPCCGKVAAHLTGEDAGSLSGLWGLSGGDRKRTGRCECTASKEQFELGLKEGELFCTLSRKMVVGRLNHLLGVRVIRLVLWICTPWALLS